jgi:hypothetical protein
MSRPGIWQRLAQALDAYVVNRTKQAVSEIILPRAKREVALCRRLMHKTSPVAAETSPEGLRVTRTRSRS